MGAGIPFADASGAIHYDPIRLGGGPGSGEFKGSTVSGASPFGDSNVTENYAVAAGNGGAVTITWAHPQTSLEILWGTVDLFPSRNVVDFGHGDTVDGQQVSDAAHAQGFGSLGPVDGTSNVLLDITELKSAFTSATFGDANYPDFEFSLAAPSSVPGPLVGAGLPGLIAGCLAVLFWPRRRTRT